MSTDKPLENIVNELLYGKGYVVMRGVLPPEVIAKARTSLMQMCDLQDFQVGGREKRTYNIIEFDPVFAELLEPSWERFGPAFEQILGKRAYLGSYHALNLFPTPNMSDEHIVKQQRQRLHSDFPFTFGQTPHTPYTMQSIWMLDKFSAERGGTLVLPSSHLIGHSPRADREDDWKMFRERAEVVEGDAGDVLVYVGQVWHSVNPNTWSEEKEVGTSYPGGKNEVRAAILGQWLPHYFSPMEDHQWRTPAHVVRSMPKLSRKLLGFDGHIPEGQRRKAWRANKEEVASQAKL